MISSTKFPAGTIHSTVPNDFLSALKASESALSLWSQITPLARNEWICWVTSAVKEETRKRRTVVGISKLESGMRRPCCWAGCVHRTKV